MSGVTVVELLITCVIVALVGAAGLSYARRGTGPRTAAGCAAPLETFLAHARARSVLAGTDSRVRFDPGSRSASGNWREAPLILAPSCVLLAVGFGVGGRRSDTVIFYQSGAASPGHVLVGAENGGGCRITIGLRGGREKRCTP